MIAPASDRVRLSTSAPPLATRQLDAQDDAPSCTPNAPKSRHRSPQQELQDWVATGDPLAILNDLLENPQRHLRVGDTLQALDAAIASAARRGTDRLIHAGFDAALRQTLSLLLRVQLLTARRVALWDRQVQHNPQSGVDHELAESLLPVTEGLHEHFIDLSKSYASVRHTLALGDRESPASSPQGRKTR